MVDDSNSNDPNKTGTIVRPEDRTVIQVAEEMEHETTPARVREKTPYVVVVDGPRQGTRFELHEGENVIGRAVSSVILLEDQSVSRRHAILQQLPDGFLVKDLGSKNGTFVNGQRIKESINIGHGDVVQVGIYAVRLITRRVSAEEEFKALPPEMEGKTRIFTETPLSGGDTAAVREEELKRQEAFNKTGRVKKKDVEETIERDGVEIPEEELEDRALVEQKPGELELVEEEEKKRPRWLTYAAMGGSLLLVLLVGLGLYWYYFMKPTPIKAPPAGKVPTPPVAAPEGQQTPPPALVPQQQKTVPVFLDFASSPLPAEVVFEGKNYGATPVKVSVELEVGKQYNAEAIFKLDDINEAYRQTVTFTAEKDKPLIPLLFKGQIGTLKVITLPKDVELYVEGFFIYDPFKGRPANLATVPVQKPVYVPYGKYKIELRRAKQVAGAAERFVSDICYQREIMIGEDNPNFEVNVTDEELTKFPIEVHSTPIGADVFVDGVKVGQTPFQGTFPLGEHSLIIRKDGYYEYSETIKNDINMLVQKQVELKTSAAGEYINAGRKFLLNGMFADAIAQLSEAFKRGPTAREMAEVYYLLGNSFFRSGDYTTSKGYFEQALAHVDFKYPAMLGLVSIYAMQRDQAKALPMLVEVMLNSQDEQVKREATALFQQVSPLRSVMYVYSDPPGAKVIINNKEVAQATPVILHDLTLGNYKVKIVKEGYEPADLNLNFSINEFNPIIVKMKKLGE